MICKRLFSSATTMPNRKAAFCIIGNEILTGKIHDRNTFFLSKFLFENGVEMVRATTIRDDVDEIASTVRDLSEFVGPDGFVFTSGGIGPTHDDVTYEGVAKAFGLGVEIHQPTFKKLNSYLQSKNQPFNEARQRMAILPKTCNVIPVLKTSPWVPLVELNNVYVLPGIPSLFSSMLEEHKSRFTGKPFLRVLVFTNLLEGEMANSLSRIQKEFPHISLGSYIITKGGQYEKHRASYKAFVSVEGRDRDDVSHVSDQVKYEISGITLPEYEE